MRGCVANYETIASELRRCSTHDTLRKAWGEAQPALRLLQPYARLWLTNLKDHRKRMIENDVIADYDEARARCDAINWEDADERARVTFAAATARTLPARHAKSRRP